MAENKFGRNYLLTIQTTDGTFVEIIPPTSIEFDFSRDNASSANDGSVKIYNLSEKTREKIKLTSYDSDIQRKMSLKAGYGNNLSFVFSGLYVDSYSAREGVNFVSHMTCHDVGYNGLIKNFNHPPYPKGTTKRQVIIDLITAIKNNGVEIGAVGDFPADPLPASKSYSGNCLSLLNELTGNSYCIDNGVLHALKDNESLDFPPVLINADSGLLGTPRYSEGLLRFDIVFEPTLYVNQLINLQSTSNRLRNGIYKVTGLKHTGTISPVVCGSAITTVTCLSGTFKPVKNEVR